MKGRKMKNSRLTFLTIMTLAVLTNGCLSEIEQKMYNNPLFETQKLKTPKRLCVGYWIGGDHTKLDYSVYTHINYIGFDTNQWGAINANSLLRSTNVNEWVKTAHKNNVKCLITLAGGNIEAMASNNTFRAAFISNVVSFINKYNLDGIDYDWEKQFTQQDKENYTALIKETREAFDKQNRKLLVTMAGTNWLHEITPEAIDYLDFLNVMAYDCQFIDEFPIHSSFAQALATLKHWTSFGFPKEKLALGLPFYGSRKDWRQEGYSDLMKACPDLAPNDNWCRDFYFNGQDLIRKKTQYVVDNGYGGVMVFRASLDTTDDTSLLKTIKDVFNKPTPPKKRFKAKGCRLYLLQNHAITV